jgi:hypothetical protein
VLTRRGKHDEGERKERGGHDGEGASPFYRGHNRVGAGGSSMEWRHTTGGREGGPGGAWRERGGGGLATTACERRCRVAAGQSCSIEQGSGGHRHVGHRLQYQAAR